MSTKRAPVVRGIRCVLMSSERNERAAVAIRAAIEKGVVPRIATSTAHPPIRIVFIYKGIHSNKYKNNECRRKRTIHDKCHELRSGQVTEITSVSQFFSPH